LGEAVISEGMACLYEEQHDGRTPIYGNGSLKDKQIAKANKLINSKIYDHSD